MEENLIAIAFLTILLLFGGGVGFSLGKLAQEDIDVEHSLKLKCYQECLQASNPLECVKLQENIKLLYKESQ